MKKVLLFGFSVTLILSTALAQVEKDSPVKPVEIPVIIEQEEEAEEIFQDQEIMDLPVEDVQLKEASDNEFIDKNDHTTLPEEYYHHPYIRYQHQVNEEGVAEAYPWLSADALRLYFTKDNQIYMSSRGSRYEDFGKPTRVEMDDNRSVISAWLSNNELEMYTCHGHAIKVFHRNSPQEPFLYQRNLELGTDLTGFVSGISFSPDMRTMVIYNSDDGQRLAVFNVTEGGRPELRKILTVPFGKIAVGQMSKDGKWLYFSVDEDPTFSIYKMDMMEVEVPVPHFNRILSLKGLRIGKPTLSYDETYICFNATASNMWQNNEIMVADLNNLSFIQQDTTIFIVNNNEVNAANSGNVTYLPVQRDLVPVKMQPSANTDASSFSLRINRLYPNPTTGAVNVKYELPVNCVIAEMFVNDMNGREIMRRKINPADHDFHFSLLEMGLAKGTYMLWINTELGNSSVHKIEYH